MCYEQIGETIESYRGLRFENVCSYFHNEVLCFLSRPRQWHSRQGSPLEDIQEH